ncbi:MAG TPA: ParB N-terminal domain-containing protein [Thermoplasmata archaeon]|nr:ParB N-terminal domain-containing protein [Thermoplasmata archaeon]
MTDPVEFALVPIESLREHEHVDPKKVERLVKEIRSTGVSQEPIWVARGSGVILNGHHRYAALKRLGARRVPAWVVDYDSDVVSIGRWSPGPEVSKSEVVRRAHAGELFPVQTTRHRLAGELPPRPTPLAELLAPAGRSGRGQSRRGTSARAASRG